MAATSKDNNLLVRECSNKGIRLTRQRRVLLEIIQAVNGHLDAATLLRLAHEQDKSIDRTTVYRTLELLKKLRISGRPDRMHASERGASAQSVDDRIHLICLRCGNVEERKSPLLQRSLDTKLSRRVALVSAA